MIWYNSSWNYRKVITVSNSGSTLSNYQTLIILDTASLITATKMRSDCGDIRITDADGSTLLYHWIESGTYSSSSTTRIWVKITSVPAGTKTIYLYYGNSSATSSASGDNTFLLFDDFTGTNGSSPNTTTKWNLTQTGGAITDIQSNMLRVYTPTGSTNGHATSKTTFTLPVIMEFNAQWPGWGNDDAMAGISGCNIWYGLSGHLRIGGYVCCSGDASGWTGWTGYTTNTLYQFRWTITSTSLKTEELVNGNSDTHAGSYANTTINFGDNSPHTAHTTNVDDVRIRQYASPEPTTCVGGEEVPTVSWLTNWNRRKLMTITGSTAGPQTDYQIKIIAHKSSGTDTSTDIYLGTNVNNDFSDLRFTSSDGSTLINYWIESYTSGSVATIWIKIPSIPASPCTMTSCVYYGNSSATSLSNGTNTFILFDNFPGSSVDTTKWNVTGSPTVSGGTLTVPTGATVISKTNFSSPTVLEFNSSYVSTGGNSTSIIQGFYLSSTNERLFHYADRNGSNTIYFTKSGTQVTVSTNWNNSSYKRKIIWNKNTPKVNWYQGDIESTNSPFTTAVNIPVVNVPIFFGGYGEYGTISISQVLVRSYTFPEPTICISGEEVSTVSWLTGWSRRKSLKTTGSTSAQTDFQMKITVHKSTGPDTSTDIYLGTNVNNDFSDLRFTTSDGSTLLNYWIESYTSGSVATVWIKIPSVPAGPCTTTIYLYYGNSSATTLSNGTNTFVDFSDFNDLTGWTQQAGTWTVSGGALQIPDTDGTFGYLRRSTTNPLNTDYIVRLRMSIEESTLVESNHRILLILNSANPLSYSTSGNTICWYEQYLTGQLNTITHDYYGTSTFTTISDYPSHTWLKSEVRISEAEDKITLWSDDLATNYGSHTTTNTKDSGDYWGFFTAYSKGQVDWILIRKYVSPDPTFSIIGTEETVTCGTPSANLIVLEILSEQLSRPYPYYVDIDIISKLLDNFK